MRSRSDGKALASEYLDSLKHQRRLSAATLENYGRALNVLHALRGDKALEGMQAAEVRRYVASMPKDYPPRSLFTLSAWRGYFRWLTRHRGFASNPVLGIRAPKAARPLPKALSVENAQRLLTAPVKPRRSASRTPRCSSFSILRDCASASSSRST